MKKTAKPFKTIDFEFFNHPSRSISRKNFFSLPPLLHEYRNRGDGGGHRGPRGGVSYGAGSDLARFLDLVKFFTFFGQIWPSEGFCTRNHPNMVRLLDLARFLTFFVGRTGFWVRVTKSRSDRRVGWPSGPRR